MAPGTPGHHVDKRVAETLLNHTRCWSGSDNCPICCLPHCPPGCTPGKGMGMEGHGDRKSPIHPWGLSACTPAWQTFLPLLDWLKLGLCSGQAIVSTTEWHSFEQHLRQAVEMGHPFVSASKDSDENKLSLLPWYMSEASRYSLN